MVLQAEEKKKMVQLKKQSIFQTFIPLLQNMTDDMKAEAGQLAGHSDASLMVKKWHMKDTLRDIKLQLSAFTNSWSGEINGQWQRNVDKLEETMALLMDLYDHIEKFEEKKDMADYYANVNYPGALQVNLTDGETIDAMTKLDFLIHDNLVLWEYNKAMSTFHSVSSHLRKHVWQISCHRWKAEFH